MIIEQTEKDFELIPAGTHVARCCGVCDLGLHKETYQGNERLVPKVRISFECPTLIMKEGDFEGMPFLASRRYTASLNEGSHLREHLISWRGKAFTPEELKKFDTKVLLGVPAQVTIVHLGNEGEKKYPGISAITGFPKGLKCPAAVNKPIDFSLKDPDYLQVYGSLNEWLQKMINLPSLMPEEPTFDEPPEADPDDTRWVEKLEDDDVPF